MMASLQQAISKGMPVDQAIAYVKSMANDGVAPLVDLYALMKQFERMKQQPTPALQTPNIREQLNMLEASRGQGQAGLPAAMPPQNPQAMMAQGLGGLSAGRMENPQFAGGGIVAFSGEGSSQVTSSGGAASDLYSQMPKTYEDILKADLARLGQDPNKFVETEEERIRREQQQRGLGEFAPSMSMREKLLAEDQAAAKRAAEEEAGYDRDEYWGDVAANAAESGATLLSSLAKAQKGKASRKRATAEKVKKATRDAKLAEIGLQQVKELEKAGRFKEAAELRKTLETKIDQSRNQIAEAAQAETAAQAAQRRAIELKQTEGPLDAMERARRRLLKAEPGSEEAAAAEDIIQGMSPSAGKMPTRYAAALRSAERAMEQAAKNARDPITGKIDPNNAELKAAQEKLQSVQRDIISKGWDIPGVTPTGAAPTSGGLQVGAVQDGYRYKGGDPSNPNSWEPVE